MASVLVVDDEDVLVDMIATLIVELGFRAVTATNGREALAALHTEPEPPFLVFSDVMMPQMNGMALVQALRNDVRFQHVPIVLMSAAGRPAASELATHFLPKPFDLDQIEHLVEHYAANS